MMNGAGGTRVDVEGDTKVGKGLFDDAVVFVDDVLRGNTLLQRFDGDGNPVFVGAADKDHIFTLHAEKPDIDVGGNINPCQMANMDWPIGIRESRCDGIAFKNRLSGHFDVVWSPNPQTYDCRNRKKKLWFSVAKIENMENSLILVYDSSPLT